MAVNRRVFIASAASFACTARLSANQQSVTRADTLAVYRDVLNKTCACCATNNDISVIDQRPSLPQLPRLDARAFSPMQRLTMPEASEPYLSPPADQISNAEEMLRDLATQYALPAQRFDEELTLTAPHMFVSASDKRQLMRFHPQNQIFSQKIQDEAHSVPRSLQKRFAHAGTMYSVSPVGFNLDATLAVLWIASSGGGCDDQQWQVLEQRAGTWTRLPWNTFHISVCT